MDTTHLLREMFCIISTFSIMLNVILLYNTVESSPINYERTVERGEWRGLRGNYSDKNNKLRLYNYKYHDPFQNDGSIPYHNRWHVIDNFKDKVDYPDLSIRDFLNYNEGATVNEGWHPNVLIRTLQKDLSDTTIKRSELKGGTGDTLIGLFIANCDSPVLKRNTFEFNYLERFYYEVTYEKTLIQVDKEFLNLKFPVRAKQTIEKRLVDMRIYFFGDILPTTFRKGFLDGVMYYKENRLIRRPVYLELDLKKNTSMTYLDEEVFGAIFKNMTAAIVRNFTHLDEEWTFIPPRSTPLGLAPAIGSPDYNSMLIECEDKRNYWLDDHILSNIDKEFSQQLRFKCSETNDDVNNYEPYKNKTEMKYRKGLLKRPIVGDDKPNEKTFITVVSVLVAFAIVIICVTIILIFRSNKITRMPPTYHAPPVKSKIASSRIDPPSENAVKVNKLLNDNRALRPASLGLYKIPNALVPSTLLKKPASRQKKVLRLPMLGPKV